MRTRSMAVIAGLMLAAAAGRGMAEEPDHPAVRRATSVPPSADLAYSVKARQKGFAINGEALSHWQAGAGKYALESESRASILGKLIETKSTGIVDNYGIAPLNFWEKRFRKDPYKVSFDRGARLITFSEAPTVTYPIKGGEQDRGTAPWQLAAVARGAPDKFVAGSEWSFFVAGRVDAQPWVFKVTGHETLKTGVGEIDAVHAVRTPPPGSRDQKLDIWLAPAHEWYPVRIRLSSEDDVLEQTIEKITRH
jgi:hypothetical protein